MRVILCEPATDAIPHKGAQSAQLEQRERKCRVLIPPQPLCNLLGGLGLTAILCDFRSGREK